MEWHLKTGFAQAYEKGKNLTFLDIFVFIKIAFSSEYLQNLYKSAENIRTKFQNARWVFVHAITSQTDRQSQQRSHVRQILLKIMWVCWRAKEIGWASLRMEWASFRISLPVSVNNYPPTTVETGAILKTKLKYYEEMSPKLPCFYSYNILKMS